MKHSRFSQLIPKGALLQVFRFQFHHQFMYAVLHEIVSPLFVSTPGGYDLYYLSVIFQVSSKNSPQNPAPLLTALCKGHTAISKTDPASSQVSALQNVFRIRTGELPYSVGLFTGCSLRHKKRRKSKGISSSVSVSCRSHSGPHDYRDLFIKLDFLI